MQNFDWAFVLGHMNYWLFIVLMMTGFYIVVAKGNEELLFKVIFSMIQSMDQEISQAPIYQKVVQYYKAN